MPETILQVDALVKRFGGLTAVDNLSLEVAGGSIHAIIGPNGSGKTTCFNVITGLYKPDGGKVLFKGQNISGLPPYIVARMGMGRTFQTLFLFRELTVLENVLIGLQCHSDYSLAKNLLADKKKVLQEKELQHKAQELLAFIGLERAAQEQAKNLPYGKQRLLEIARALGTSPGLILLDEPAAGMNPQETMALVEKVRMIRDKLGVTVLIIEHNMRLIMNLAEKITVLDYGAKICEGYPRDVGRDPKVIEAYLGVVGQKSANL